MIGFYSKTLNDLGLDIPANLIPGLSSVNKFGRSMDVDDHDTDIWDGAVAGDAGDEWVAPTQARKHNLKSSSVNDTNGGSGANIIKIYGLTSWGKKEVSELITMNGTTDVETVNDYVIIHRMKIVPVTGSGINDGVITATSVVDIAVTAQISAGEGQTQMAIYGIPGGITAYMTNYYVSTVKRAASLSAKISLLVNPAPDVDISTYIIKHTVGLTTEGSNYVKQMFTPYFAITGPAIIKINANSSAVGTDVSAGFDLILVDTE